MVRFAMIVRVTQTIDPTGTIPEPRTDGIVADFRATMMELKCVGSERLLRQGISMTQLHILHMLERHGQMPMSRLAEVLDVSVSNATGLVDRMEERGLVARTRVPEDRRVVLVQVSPRGSRCSKTPRRSATTSCDGSFAGSTSPIWTTSPVP